MSASESLVERLRRHARSRPAEAALAGPGGEVSWAALARGAGHLARSLAEEPAGALLVVGGNRPEVQVALLGGLWAGRAVLPVAGDATARELADLAHRARASHWIGGGTPPDGRAWVCRDLDGLLPPGGAGDPDPPERPGGAVLLESSGTTGPSKLVRRGSEGLAALGAGLAEALALGPGERLLLTIPLHHSYGIDTGLAAATWAGATLVLHPRFDPGAVRGALADEGIQLWPAVPLMLDALTRGQPGRCRAPALRRVISAGSPLPRRIFDAFLRVYGRPVGQLYGASEFGSVALADPADPDFDPGSVGRPLPGVRLRLAPREDRDPGGEEGEAELLVAAPTMMEGYLDAAEGPDADGFLRTGDLARCSESGAWTLTGRVKLLIDVGARKVNPFEVEAVLGEHPEVAEVVVVPLPYSDTSERLRAVVVPMEGCDPDPESIRAFARERLSSHKVPRRIEVRTRVPRSPTGKILRRALSGAGAPAGESGPRAGA